MTLKKTLLAGAAGAALFAFAAPVATPAEAGAIKNGAATDLTVYGQVSRSILFYDDGEESDIRHQDADNSSTRFGFKASGKVNESVTMGAHFEVELQSNPSNNITQGGTTSADADTLEGLNERLAYVYIEHKQFGRVTMGQESDISDGMSDGLDLSGAAFAFSGMDIQLGNGGGLQFRNSAGVLQGTSNQVADHFGTFDRGRRDLLEYQTPNFAGANIEVAAYSEGDWGMGLNYDQKHGSLQVRGRAFYENLSDTASTEATWQIGASVKHDSGVSVTGLYGERERTSGDAKKVYSARLGYTANMNSLGATGVAINYLGTDDFANQGDDATSFGVGVVQQIKSAGAQLFGAVNHYDVDLNSGTSTDSIVTVVVGANVKF